MNKIKEYYNSEIGFKKYAGAIEKVGLWNSEKTIFEKYVKLTDKILDIGCGAGRTTINLYKLGYNYIMGLDIAEKLIEYANYYSKHKNLNISFIEGDATSLEFHDKCFDIAFFSFNGFMTIPTEKDRQTALKEIYRVLKKGGKFIFTAHDKNKNSLQKLLNSNGDIISPTTKFFLHIPDIEEVKELLMKEKFEILEYKKRSEIAKENDAVNNFSDETIFWIAKKK